MFNSLPEEMLSERSPPFENKVTNKAKEECCQNI